VWFLAKGSVKKFVVPQVLDEYLTPPPDSLTVEERTFRMLASIEERINKRGSQVA
jgi:hypothetical protein